jgi:hypothetical protein
MFWKLLSDKAKSLTTEVTEVHRGKPKARTLSSNFKTGTLYARRVGLAHHPYLTVNLAC